MLRTILHDDQYCSVGHFHYALFTVNRREKRSFSFQVFKMILLYTFKSHTFCI